MSVSLNWLQQLSETPIEKSMAALSVCRFLSALIESFLASQRKESESEVYIPQAVVSRMLAYAVTWSVGGYLNSSSRERFSILWVKEFTDEQHGFPTDGSIFDYILDAGTWEWSEIERLVPSTSFSPYMWGGGEDQSADLYVPTPQGCALDCAVQLLMKHSRTKTWLQPQY